MNLSTKFAVSVHILGVLYYNPDLVCTSELIAGSVNTNPVVIRRLVSSLKKAGMVTSASGMGGVKPMRPPEEITLYEVYDAVENVDSLLFGLHEIVNPQCPVGRNINTVLRGKMSNMQFLLLNFLKRTTMADVLEDIIKEIRQEQKEA